MGRVFFSHFSLTKRYRSRGRRAWGPVCGTLSVRRVAQPALSREADSGSEDLGGGVGARPGEEGRPSLWGSLPRGFIIIKETKINDVHILSKG